MRPRSRAARAVAWLLLVLALVAATGASASPDFLLPSSPLLAEPQSVALWHARENASAQDLLRLSGLPARAPPLS